jgi:UDPglucose 6-dehydrogenase/GDP-mannose 6-dehydrogenase
MRVCVVGAGYVGLVTGACLADRGHQVICAERDASKVEAINRGAAPIHEAGLPELLARTVGRTLRATTSLPEAIAASEISLICVGTPFGEGMIDLGAIEAAAAEIGSALAGTDRWHTVVVRSTVVPGTTDSVVLPIVERASGLRAGEGFGIGMNPEFLTEGTALADFLQQDRIVIGALDERSRAAIEGLYAGFHEVPRVCVNPRTAEMIKYASNALLATAISFSNEFADLCEALGGIDAVEVMRGVHLSRYLTAQAPAPAGWTAPLAGFLEAGCGYGGSCLPKDVKALAAHGHRLGLPMPLLGAVDLINAGRADRLLAPLTRAFDTLAGRSVAVLGLSFKPDTDDTRETPARQVVARLLALGARVTVFDPVSANQAERLFGAGAVTVADSLAAAVAEAEAVILVTRWPEFQALPDLLAGRDDPPLVVDGRRVLDRARLRRYAGIGLG